LAALTGISSSKSETKMITGANKLYNNSNNSNQIKKRISPSESSSLSVMIKEE